MTRRIEAGGDSLEEALARAVAELADCDVSDVEIKLAAPDLVTDVETRLTLEVATAAADGQDDDSDEDEQDEPRARQQRQDRAPAAAQDRAPRDEDDEDIDLDAEADAAADFLEGLLDMLELPGDLKIRITEEHAEVEIVDVGSGALIGRRGQTLEAIQELARCALQREFQRRSHVKIDIEGYRERRLEKLLEKAEEAIESVLETGETERLEPMDVFERKAVHHLVAEYDGVTSRSQGREPARRVMIEPA
ncbi:MAG: KH domain-containing protein [Actinobacteria bacterium]|nr:KH domain-containing protein [Actinomycetota bacterium]